jgi:hypothetical protein
VISREVAEWAFAFGVCLANHVFAESAIVDDILEEVLGPFEAGSGVGQFRELASHFRVVCKPKHPGVLYPDVERESAPVDVPSPSHFMVLERFVTKGPDQFLQVLVFDETGDTFEDRINKRRDFVYWYVRSTDVSCSLESGS